MADLKNTYKDDVLDTSVNTQRKYQMITNDDGTVSFVDVTVYSQVGDSFGASDINATNSKVNETNSSLMLATEYPYAEQKVGTWVDGKPLYRKMLQFGALHNGNNAIAHGCANVKHIHVNIGESYWKSGSYDTNSGATDYSFSLIHEAIKEIYVNPTTVTIITSSDLSTFNCLLCLEYTKTTD